MEKKISFSIKDFSGGMTSNPRSDDFRFSQLIKNFDINLYPKRLSPVRDTESGDSAASTSKKQNFAVALRTGTTYSLYALGVILGGTKAEVLYKNLTVDSTNDLTDDGWVALGASAKYQSSTGTSTNFNLFTYYKKAGRIYGVRDNQYIWAYDPAGTQNFNDSAKDLGSTFTNHCQGIVHSKDDILYMGFDNVIIKFDGTTWSTSLASPALTLPTHYKITSLCEYGNYLAIACAPVSGFGNSKVFLWDMSATSWNESIDWGEGNLVILEEIEGRLIGISYVGYPATFKGKVVFREYGGGIATVFNQLIVDLSVVMNILHKQKVNQYLYFPLSCTLNGATLRGIWRIGRNMPTEPFALSLYQFASNDSTTTPLVGFFIVGDYVFVSYTDVAGTTYSLSKTNNSASYTATSIYESLILNFGDSRLEKQLVGITVMTDELPHATTPSVVLKYQTDENVGSTSWTTIFTHTVTTAGSFVAGRKYKIVSAGTTDFTLVGAADSASGTVFTATGVGSGTGTAIDFLVSYSAVNITAEFKEIVFRIESTGGAVITGLEGKVAVMGKDIYS